MWWKRSGRSLFQYFRVSYVKTFSNTQKHFHQFLNAKSNQHYLIYLGCAVALASSTTYFIKSLEVSSVVKAESNKKKLVILGCGWGAVNLIKTLDPDLYDVKIVSPTNYFLFTPLLPSVTVGTLDGRSLVEPIRNLLGKKRFKNVDFFEAACTDVDFDNKKVHCVDKSDIIGANDEFDIDYDILVVAVGSKTATYGNDDIEKFAHKLKNVSQAQLLRKNIIDVLESAAIPSQNEAEVRRLLNFVVVGGGPTGVEFASELRDYIDDLMKVYPPSLVDKVSITLVNSHYKVLSMYDEQISNYTEKKFKSDGINGVYGCYVVGIDGTQIQVKDKKTKEISTIPYGICVWAAGIAPRTITKTMMTKIPNQNNRNALITDGYLKVKNTDNVFGIGDCATVAQTKMLVEVEELFRQADKDGNGEMDFEEFQEFLEIAKKKYPDMIQHLEKCCRVSSVTFEKLDVDKDHKLSLKEFAKFLEEVDKKLTSFPATAQVACQQGKYLGKLLSQHPEIYENDFSKCDSFKYSHLGSFAYVGGNEAVLQLPIIGSFTGLVTMWLWRGAYLNEAVSWRMSILIGMDWIKSHVFGRDTSRI